MEKNQSCTGRCAELSLQLTVALHDNEQLARELVAVTASLDECRRERGEALDALTELSKRMVQEMRAEGVFNGPVRMGREVGSGFPEA